MGRDGINFGGISNVKVEFTPLQKLWVQWGRQILSEIQI